MKTGTEFIPSAFAIFHQYKTLAEKAIKQIEEKDMWLKPQENANSIYIIMKHLSGNMQSRWTDFLLTDGEK
jgi:hypothetical protein